MSDWNNPKSISMTFDLKAGETAVDFFNRTINGLQDFESAINARTKQLFDENIGIGGEKAGEAHGLLLKLFRFGYGHGWNDRKELTGESVCWKMADGDELPDIDREVIALTKQGKVVFAHRPQESWTGKSIATGEVTSYHPARYGKGQWNQADILYWLDVNIPETKEQEP